jgi:hypothetical protein
MKSPRRKQGKRSASLEAQAGLRQARRIRDRIPGWVEVTAAVAGILAFGFAFGPKLLQPFEHQKPVAVELGEITVSNPDLDFSGAGQTPESEPTITATVRNDGTTTAWVDEALVTVLDGTRVPVCFTQGGGPDVPHSKPYRVTMPEFPTADQRVIRRPLHVEVQPGHGARPLLRFQKLLTSTTDLYSIDVKYVVDPGEEILDAGRFLIGVPGPPARGGYTLPESEAALTAEEFRQSGADVSPVTAWCLRHNLEGVRRLAAEPGRRSALIAALSNVRTAPAWAEVEDHESPREAVETLLESEALDAPLFAVEAAAETGDTAYEEEVRKRAVALLIERGEEDLGDAAIASVGDAERALSLEPSEKARSLLTEAKDAAIAQEESWEKELEEEALAAGE